MSDSIEFLTNSQINRDKILDVLKQYRPNNSDKHVLTDIIKNFSNNNFSLLTTQEIQYLNRNPEKIWPDYLIFRQKFKQQTKEHMVTDFPLYLLIEPVSACNLRCVMCFQIDKTFSGDKNFMGLMDFELFKQVIDESYKKGTKAVTLASRGEPTLHPKLGDMLEYCSGKFLELKINTNATKLSEKLIHQILQTGVTDVVFSIDSYTKENYESIRVGGIFDQVLENIKRFQEIRTNSYPDSKCVTRVSGVKVDESQNKELFKKFWEQYVDHVVMVDMVYRWDTYHNPKDIMAEEPCAGLWERMYVWYDGKCNPCDADYKSELFVGSVTNSSIEKIWNGEKFNQLRSMHLQNKRNNYYPCDRCPIGS